MMRAIELDACCPDSGHWWIKARKNILSRFVGLIKNGENNAVLEIGCGRGGNLTSLFPQFSWRIGIDSSVDAIFEARSILTRDTHVLVGDANYLPFKNESVHCVAMLDVLYHREIKDVDLLFSQVYNLLRKDGYLLISDGAFQFLEVHHWKTVGSARRFRADYLKLAVQKAGFTVMKLSYWGFWLFFLLFVKRALLEKILAHEGKPLPSDLVSFPLMNSLLYRVTNIEQYILPRWSIPLGSSIVLLAKK